MRPALPSPETSRSFASVERLSVLAADRGKVFGVGALRHARLELAETLLEPRGHGVALERGEPALQCRHVLALRLGKRHLAAQLALLAMHRLERLGDLHE